MYQKGFSPILVIISVIIITVIGGLILFRQNFIKVELTKSSDSPDTVPPQSDNMSNQDESGPPLKLKSIGVNFEDFEFTKQKLQFSRLFMGFGFIIPGSMASTAQDKSNPQPTFILPIGTPVRSLVDGVVVAMPKLWSGDISVQVTADGKMEKWVYETEHVINPKVKVGDKVKAGQVIAEVSDFDKGAPLGFGAVEIGILKGGNPPEHICPFAYLDDSIKEEAFIKMKNLFKSWEEYTGDQSLYDESLIIPGCLILDPIEG